MSATFVTDLCTALALSAIFIKPNIWFPVFLVVSLALILALPKIAPWFFGRYGDRVIEPEIKLVFFCLARADGPRRRLERARRSTCVRARLDDEQALRGAPGRANASPRRGVRLPDALLLHQGWAERVSGSRSGEPRPARRAPRSQDGPEGGLRIYRWLDGLLLATRRSRPC